jgi:hypothetical protein
VSGRLVHGEANHSKYLLYVIREKKLASKVTENSENIAFSEHARKRAYFDNYLYTNSGQSPGREANYKRLIDGQKRIAIEW